VVDKEEKADSILDLMQFLARTGGFHTLKLPDNLTDVHLAYLKNPRCLLKLSLEGCSEISNVGLEYLPKGLKSLELNSCTKITDDGLKSIVTFYQLEHLSLAMTNISDDGIKTYSKQFPGTLNSLSLWNCAKITDAAIPYLPKTIITLYLRRTKITDAALGQLSRGLMSLDLSGTKVSNAGLKSLPPHLHSLVLYYTGVTDQGILEIPGLKDIFHLDIRTTKVDANGAKKIKDCFVTSDVELLHESVPPPAGMTFTPL